jgi:hypothetical protein
MESPKGRPILPVRRRSRFPPPPAKGFGSRNTSTHPGWAFTVIRAAEGPPLCWRSSWFDPNSGEFEFPDYKQFQKFFEEIFACPSCCMLDELFLIHTCAGFPNASHGQGLWETSLGHSVAL